MASSLAITAYAVALAAAAASDLVRYEIPPGLSPALAALYLWPAATMPLGTTLAHVAAGGSVLVATTLCFYGGVMGGGDAKLIAAVAVWLGWRNLVPFVLLTALAGAVLGLVLLALRRTLPRPPRAGRWYSRVLAPRAGVPYAIAIATAGLVLLPRLLVPGS
jgi:prepilin peptidase CpaA